MLIQILTLFPEMFTGPLENSIIKRAREQKLVDFRLINFREFTIDKHRTVDDTPYGGGSGMVLKPEPLFRALQFAKEYRECAQVVLLTPQGRVFRQETARQLATVDHLILISRYSYNSGQPIDHDGGKPISLSLRTRACSR